jgi:DNA-binding NarL/FixJ family response regulator
MSSVSGLSADPFSASPAGEDFAAVGPAEPLRVWLCDEQASFRQLLAGYLGLLPGIEIAGGSGDPADLREGAAGAGVVIADPGPDFAAGLAALHAFAGAAGGPAILILCARADEAAVFRAARAGVRGYVLKSDAVTEVGTALGRIRAGGVHFSAGPRQSLARFAFRAWAQADRGGQEIRPILQLIETLVPAAVDALLRGPVRSPRRGAAAISG